MFTSSASGNFLLLSAGLFIFPTRLPLAGLPKGVQQVAFSILSLNERGHYTTSIVYMREVMKMTNPRSRSPPFPFDF